MTNANERADGNFRIATTKSVPFRCLVCDAPTGVCIIHIAPIATKNPLDPNGQVTPIPKIIDPRQYQK